MTPPAVLIIVQLETAIQVVFDCVNDGEEQRVWDWIESHPEYGPIIARALELADQERAT